LAVDVSLSVDDVEYGLQMQGIAAAFRDPEVVKLIAGHDHGVAVTMTQWTGTYESAQPLPWRLLTDEASVQAFAAAVASVPRSDFGNFTGLGYAIAFATSLIETNQYEGDEKKIDISGDGRSNSGPEPRETRLVALANDITVNGLPIINSEPQLASYYSQQVIIGPASFVIVAKDFNDFAEAFKRKLKRELSPKVAQLQ
jgi:Ca-activated chloride channel homolog